MKASITRKIKSLQKRVKKNGAGDYLWRIEKQIHTTIDNHDISYQEKVSLKKYASDEIDKMTKNLSTNTCW